MSQVWQIVVTTDDSNATIHSELSPAGSGTTGNTDAAEWLRTVATWLDSASVGSKNVSIVYTDSAGSTTVKQGMP